MVIIIEIIELKNNHDYNDDNYYKVIGALGSFRKDFETVVGCWTKSRNAAKTLFAWNRKDYLKSVGQKMERLGKLEYICCYHLNTIHLHVTATI